MRDMSRLIFALGFAVALTAAVGAVFAMMFLAWWGLSSLGLSAGYQAVGFCGVAYLAFFGMIGFIVAGERKQ